MALERFRFTDIHDALKFEDAAKELAKTKPWANVNSWIYTLDNGFHHWLVDVDVPGRFRDDLKEFANLLETSV